MEGVHRPHCNPLTTKYQISRLKNDTLIEPSFLQVFVGWKFVFWASLLLDWLSMLAKVLPRPPHQSHSGIVDALTCVVIQYANSKKITSCRMFHFPGSPSSLILDT
jgi:hypothetical protein